LTLVATAAIRTMTPMKPFDICLIYLTAASVDHKFCMCSGTILLRPSKQS
jgi:hypothetical protein